MPIPTSSILARVNDTLQDPGTRWTEPERLRYLSDGVRALITVRPDASTQKSHLTPAVGARQTLPDEAVSLIDVLGNATGTRAQISKVDAAALSAVSRNWQSLPGTEAAIHFTYDPREPRTFYLYPPNNGAGLIELLYSVYPADLVDATGEVALPMQWSNALVAYVLARAYAKDAEYAANAQLAGTYMAAFNAEISTQLQASSAVAPKA